MARVNKIQKQRIREWLKANDLKQAHLVKRLNVSRSTVSRMLNQGHIPEDPVLVVRLAIIMGCDVDDLLVAAPKRAVA